MKTGGLTFLMEPIFRFGIEAVKVYSQKWRSFKKWLKAHQASSLAFLR